MLEPVEPHQVDGARHRVAPRGAGHAAGLQTHPHVLRDGEPRQQGERLKHHSRGSEDSVERLAPIEDGPCGRSRQSREQAQQRALAAPRGADESHDFLRAHRETDVAQRLQHLAVRLPEPLAHLPGFEQDLIDHWARV